MDGRLPLEPGTLSRVVVVIATHTEGFCHRVRVSASVGALARVQLNDVVLEKGSAQGWIDLYLPC